MRLIEAEQPSVIVMTGDRIDSRRTRVESALALAEQRTALAPADYVTGNHEARVPERAARLMKGLRSGVFVCCAEKRSN